MSDTDEVCNNCKRNIPAANVDLHFSHCVKNLRLCTLCDDPIPIREFDEHVKEEHGEVECNKCKAKFRQGEEQIHERMCPMAEMKCEYCELEVPRRDIVSHLDVCGSRTDTCDICQERVMLKGMLAHVCRPRGSERAGRLATASVARTSTSPYALQPLSNNIYQTEGLSHSTEIGADYLDELIATEHFNPLNGSAVDLDAALAAQLAHDASRQTQNHETTRPAATGPEITQRPRSNGDSQCSMLPCEFCEAMFPFDQLILHQTGCLENSISVVNPAPPPQLDELDGPRYDTYNDSYIPCEFCCRQFPLSVITQHQAGCTPTRRVPSYSQIADERPIRPAPNLAPRPTPTRPTPTHKPGPISSSKKRVKGKSAVRGEDSSSGAENQPSEYQSPPSTHTTTNQLVPKPKMILPGAGKEPLKVKNTRVLKTNNMNDLGKASSSKAVPTIVIPKRRPGAHVGRAGTNNSSSDNNSNEPWITSPKIINKNPLRTSSVNGASQNGRKAINGRENTGRSGDMNNFSGANKKSASGKDIRINVSTSENRRARENLLSKYKQRDKTFVVSNTKSDETS